MYLIIPYFCMSLQWSEIKLRYIKQFKIES